MWPLPAFWVHASISSVSNDICIILFQLKKPIVIWLQSCLLTTYNKQLCTRVLHCSNPPRPANISQNVFRLDRNAYRSNSQSQLVIVRKRRRSFIPFRLPALLSWLTTNSNGNTSKLVGGQPEAETAMSVDMEHATDAPCECWNFQDRGSSHLVIPSWLELTVAFKYNLE